MARCFEHGNTLCIVQGEGYSLTGKESDLLLEKGSAS